MDTDTTSDINNNNTDSSHCRDETINTPAEMARQFNVPYLGKLPMDPNMMNACEKGVSFLDTYPTSTAAIAFSKLIDQIIESTNIITT